jgi:hypothetical protein
MPPPISGWNYGDNSSRNVEIGKLPVAGYARDVGAPEDEMPGFLALDLYTLRPRTADSFGIAIGDLDGLGID